MVTARTGGGDRQRRARLPKRVAAVALSVGVAASTVGLLPFAGTATPAVAAGNQDGVRARLGNTMQAYLRAGESLVVSGSGTALGTITAPDGTTYSGAGTHGPATQDGVWTVELNSQGPDTGYDWTVDVTSGGSVVPGRVWSTLDRIVQPGGTAAQTDLNYWVVNDTGYVYAVELGQYNGVNSDIRANSVGWANDDCTPSYASFEFDPDGIGENAPQLPNCGETFRIFFEEPAADLPATASSPTGEVSVLPPVLATADVAVTDLAFTPASYAANAGTFTYSINSRFTGGYELQIDVNGNGDYSDDVDRVVTLGADGSGSYSYEFDGLDGNGEPLAMCTQLGARIHFDKLGEVHIVQNDVEGRAGGIEITRLNGAGAPDPTVHWNDEGMPGAVTTTTPVLVGVDVDSTGGVHGWDYDTQGWGNGRYIDDWAYLPADFATGEIQVGGSCLGIEKTSDATTATRVGDTVNYTVTATNLGDLDFTADNPAVFIDDLSAVLDDATYNADGSADQSGEVSYQEPLLSWTGPLAAGESVDLTYSVTLTAGGDGSVHNIAFVSECDPADADCLPQTPTECETDDPFCDDELYELPRLTIDKQADRSELPAVGESVEYTITVTNEGPGVYTTEAPATFTDDLSDVLDSATYNADAQASTGELDYTEPVLSWQGELAAGESATVTYTATYLGGGDTNLRNLACVPADEVLPGAAPCDFVDIPGAELTQWKQVTASETPVVADTVLTYTLFFNNDGTAAATVDAVDDLTHVLDDADVIVEPTSPNGLEVNRDDNRIAITGSVPAGETYQVTYQVAVKADDDRGDDLAANFLLHNDPENPPGTPDEPVCVPEDDQLPDCTVTPIGRLTTSKAVAGDTDPVEAGTVLTYTLTFVNDGEGAVPVDHVDHLADVLDDATLTGAPTASDDALAVSDVSDDSFGVTGELSGGQTVTVTYEVTVNPESERGNNTAANFLVPNGEDPGEVCEEADPNCTTTHLPEIQVTKDADPESGSDVQAGQQVTYTLTFTNTGEAAGPVDHTDHLVDVLDDAAVSDEPISSDPALAATPVTDARVQVTGSLEPGETVTVTYTVTVKPDGERGDNRLRNVVAKTEVTDPDCGATGVVCTEHPIGELGSWKTADPAMGTTLQPGAEATYTLHFENTGKAPVTVAEDDVLTRVLDDADVTTEPAASNEALVVSQITDGRFTVTGTLEPGQVATVSYTVTVKPDGDRGDDRLDNFLVPTGETPSDGPCVPADPERPDCTTHHVSNVTVAKSSDPETGTTVSSGREVTYTVTFTNVSTNPEAAATPIDHTDHLVDVLDDATVVNDPVASSDEVAAQLSGDTIRFTGEVPAGEVITVSYTVKVKEYADQGDHRLDNVVAVTGEEPVCTPNSPVCTTHPTSADAPGKLPDTGSTVGPALGLAGAALLLGGALALKFSRSRREA